jgi:antitoxin (DNA-binding transcriptional repressor) of toxin-antitoxin stability system
MEPSMTHISIAELERDPHAALQRVEDGESLLVLRDRQPIAEIRPANARSSEPRPYGLCAGAFDVPADFDAALPEEVLRQFEGQ